MNLPNLLSLFRLVLVPVFPIVFFQPFPSARYWAAAVYVVAFLTDIADGYIARHFRMVTRLGRVLDPLADKLMTFAVIVSITVAGIIPVWAVAVFVAKELVMSLGALLMFRRTDDIMPSNYLGKASTGAFFIVCAALVLFPAIPAQAASLMIGFALLLAVAALAVYIVGFFAFSKAHRKDRHAGKTDNISRE